MKNLAFFCLLAFLAFETSCDKLFPKKEDDHTLSGNTDLDLSKTGNTFTSYANVNGAYSNITATANITKNDDGIATIHINANLKNAPELTSLKNLIPAKYFNSQGNLDLEGKVKVTDKGMMDYTNADGEPFVMVRYDAKVGDTYQLEKKDGNTITRKVTAVSTEDNFPYGMLLIKTITVEQDSRIPGIQKIVYRLNHKFGLVYVEAVAQDGSKAGITLFPQNY